MTDRLDMQPDIISHVEQRRGGLISLCERLGVSRLDLFGSAVTGAFDPNRSDLDFIVAFGPLPPGSYAKACFALRMGLEHLFGRPVDLLTDAALVNPYFRHQVRSQRRTLYPPP